MPIEWVVVMTVIIAFGFDVINGFHDSANSIATVVSTRVLKPRTAVFWAAFFNFVAMFVFAPKVADTISKIVKVNVADPAFVYVVLCGLIGAIVWAFEVDGFWLTFGVLCVGLPVAVFIATLPIALAQAMRAIADVGDTVAAR